MKFVNYKKTSDEYNALKNNSYYLIFQHVAKSKNSCKFNFVGLDELRVHNIVDIIIGKDFRDILYGSTKF